MKQTVLTILLFSTLTLLAREKDVETRTATMTVPIKGDQKLILNMKNTALKMETWDKDEVLIEATLKINSSMTAKREAFLANWQQNVENTVSNSNYAVEISSALEEAIEVTKKTFLGMVIYYNVEGFDKAYDVTYTIKAPGSNPLKIVGSYEDVSLVGYFDEVDLNLYSADFEADSIISADLGLKYGSATVKGIKRAEITLYENELEVEDITYLKLKTKYSEVEIEELGACEVDAYESDFVLGSTDAIKGVLKYGELEIVEKTGYLDVELYEVDLELGEVIALEMRSKYSNLTAESVETFELVSSYEDEFEIEVLGTLKSMETKYGKYNIGKFTDSFELEGYEDNLWIDAVTGTATKIRLDGKYVKTTIKLNDTPTFLTIDAVYGDFSFDKSTMEVSRMIEEGNNKEIVAKTKGIGESGLKIEVTGYEMDLNINE